MSDIKPFKHGEEGIHSVCNKHNIGGKSVCCECSGKKDCSDVSTTPKNSEWKGVIKACFLTERMTDWPLPTVRVNPDTLLTVVKGLLQERSKEGVGELEKWAEGRRRNGYNVVRGSCAFCGIDPEDCDCDGYNDALDDLVSHLQKLSEQLNQK